MNCDSELEKSKDVVANFTTTIENNNAELINSKNNGKTHSNNNSNNSNTDINLTVRPSPSKRFLTRTKSNIQQHHGVPHSTQERRITIMLISVVILFLCCQLPSAIMILYTATRELKSNSNEHALVLAFGNIFNFLMAVNAAGNFILYSLLSKKYRRTFMRLFCNCFRSKKKNHNNNRDRKTFSVRFEAVGHSIRNKGGSIYHSPTKTPINKSADKTRPDTLV